MIDFNLIKMARNRWEFPRDTWGAPVLHKKNKTGLGNISWEWVQDMKMVIVQIEKKIAVALGEDGTFIKIPQRGYQIGQTLTNIPSSKGMMGFSRGVVAAAIIILFGGSGVFAARMPYSYVTMDVNPSVKYTLNIFDHVLTIDAINEDAEPIVEALTQQSVNYSKLDDAIDRTIEQCQQNGYLFKDSKDYVVLSVMSVSSGRTGTLAKKLEQHSYGNGIIEAQIVSSSIEEMKKDEQQGTTPGKLKIINKMKQKTGDDKPSEEWIHVPIRQIIETSTSEDASEELQFATKDESETQKSMTRQRASNLPEIEKQDFQDIPASTNSIVPYSIEDGSTPQLERDRSNQSQMSSPEEKTTVSPPIFKEPMATEVLNPGIENEDLEAVQGIESKNSDLLQATEPPFDSQLKEGGSPQVLTEMPSSDAVPEKEASDERQLREQSGRQPDPPLGR